MVRFGPVIFVDEDGQERPAPEPSSVNLPVSSGIPGWDTPKHRERLISVTDENAYCLIGTRPAGPNERGIISHRLYLVMPASMEERLALLTPGRRVCAW